MLSDHEQRVLEDLERSLSAGTPGPAGHPPARTGLPAGLLAVVVLGCVSVGLLVAGVPVAALALATATAIGWLFFRLWVHRADDGGLAASLVLGAGHGRCGPRRRPGESIRQYLRWLAEAE